METHKQTEPIDWKFVETQLIDEGILDEYEPEPDYCTPIEELTGFEPSRNYS